MRRFRDDNCRNYSNSKQMCPSPEFLWKFPKSTKEDLIAEKRALFGHGKYGRFLPSGCVTPCSCSFFFCKKTRKTKGGSNRSNERQRQVAGLNDGGLCRFVSRCCTTTIPNKDVKNEENAGGSRVAATAKEMKGTHSLHPLAMNTSPL